MLSCFFLRMRNVSEIFVDKIKQTFHFSNFVFRKSFPLWDNVEKHCRVGQSKDDNIIWRMRTACRVPKPATTHVISGFRREVDENCVLLGHYAVSGCHSLPTFRDNLSVPSSKVKNPKRKPGFLLRGLYNEEFGRWWVSAVRCQPGGLMQVEGGRRSVAIRLNVEGRFFGSGKFLNGQESETKEILY